MCQKFFIPEGFPEHGITKPLLLFEFCPRDVTCENREIIMVSYIANKADPYTDVIPLIIPHCEHQKSSNETAPKNTSS